MDLQAHEEIIGKVALKGKTEYSRPSPLLKDPAGAGPMVGNILEGEIWKKTRERFLMPGLLLIFWGI